MAKYWVNGYTREDGVKVKGHWRESNTARAGSVAIKQAMRELGADYRTIASKTGVNPRTAWQHVAAKKGSNVARWENRPASVKASALKAAKRLLGIK